MEGVLPGHGEQPDIFMGKAKELAESAEDTSKRQDGVGGLRAERREGNEIGDGDGGVAADSQEEKEWD